MSPGSPAIPHLERPGSSLLDFFGAWVSHGGLPPGNPAARGLRGNGRKANRRLDGWPKVREPA